MAINNFKPFALDPNANVTSQADWEALPALLSGFTAGKASSAQVNKAIRQASFIAAALAQYTANKSGLDVLDDGDLNGFISKMGTAFGKDFQALDATLSALAGLATGANKLPYFTGNDTAAQTDLTSVGRDIIGKNTIADILTYLGLGDAIGYVGRLLNTRVFTSSGTYTPTPGTKKIRVRAVGGGGGGGGVPATASGSQATAKGGESGAYVEAIITLATTADIIVTIGTGGAGGAVGSNTGVDGGATTLGSLLTCPGGKGGEGGATSTTNFVTSDASSQMAPTTTGTIVSAIGTCRPSLGRVGLANAASVGGAGGSSMLGFGGGGGTANSASRIESVRGAGFGAGGGGGSSCVGSAAMAGAAGTSGAIFIEEFA